MSDLEEPILAEHGAQLALGAPHGSPSPVTTKGMSIAGI